MTIPDLYDLHEMGAAQQPSWPDRDAVDAKMFDLSIPRHFAVRYTGRRRPGTIYMLYR